MIKLSTFLFLLAFIIGSLTLVRWLVGRVGKPSRTPEGPLPPERVREKVGSCGVHGCPNKRPHSHVDALVKRLKDDP